MAVNFIGGRLKMRLVLLASLLLALTAAFAGCALGIGYLRQPAKQAPAAARRAPTPGTPLPITPAPGQRDLVALGRELATRNGCLACHATTAQVLVGPGWKGLYGKVETLQNGRQVTVDDAYIRESILNPNAKVVKGFQPIMPQFRLSEDEIKALIEFMKSLR